MVWSSRGGETCACKQSLSFKWSDPCRCRFVKRGIIVETRFSQTITLHDFYKAVLYCAHIFPYAFWNLRLEYYTGLYFVSNALKYMSQLILPQRSDAVVPWKHKGDRNIPLFTSFEGFKLFRSHWSLWKTVQDHAKAHCLFQLWSVLRKHFRPFIQWLKAACMEQPKCKKLVLQLMEETSRNQVIVWRGSERKDMLPNLFGYENLEIYHNA